MEKTPSDEVPEENATEATEEMNSDEVLSESAEITDNTDSANEASALDKKPETSESDTSGIEIVSTSMASASDNPREGASASEMAQPSSVQNVLAETELATSASEIPCEGVALSDTEERTEPSSVQTESEDEVSKSIASTAEIQNEGAESSSAEEKQGLLPIESEMVSQSVTPGSDIPCEQKSDAVKDAAASETSPRPKKTIMEKVKKFLSPTKSKKSKESRSKSMSPTEKTKSCATEDGNSTPEEARISSEGEEKVEGEKTSMFNMKSIRRRFSKLSIKLKSSGTESTSLVTGEANKRAEEANTSQPKTEVETKNTEQSASNFPRWTNNRTSLVEAESLGGTTMTDVASTSSSSVFSAFSSRKQSAAGENASEEALAGSLVNSTDEQISEIKEDSTTKECAKNDGPSKEKEETAAPENAEQEQCSSKENPECKDEGNPESDN